MNAEQFFGQLNELLQKNEIDKAELYLIKMLEDVKEKEDYAAYIVVGNEMIGFYRNRSRFREAFDIAEDVLLLMEELQLETSEHFAATLLNTAAAYRAAGDLNQAYRYYVQALPIYAGVLPKDDYRFVGLYNDMSILLEQMDDNEKAIGLLKKALAIVENLQDSESEQAAVLTDLALLYFKINETENAAAAFNKALEIFEGAGDTERADAHYSAALTGAGEVYYRMGEYSKALTAYEKALNEVDRYFGRNHSYKLLCENCAAVSECLEDKEKAQHYRKLAANLNIN